MARTCEAGGQWEGRAGPEAGSQEGLALCNPTQQGKGQEGSPVLVLELPGWEVTAWPLEEGRGWV